jgi:hypothetical protein
MSSRIRQHSRSKNNTTDISIELERDSYKMED